MTPEFFETVRHYTRDTWLARAAVTAIIALQTLVINDLSLGPRWLAPGLELALLVPLSIASVWTQTRARLAGSHHGWHLWERQRRVLRGFARVLTALVSLMNLAALVALVRLLLKGHQATGHTLLVDALNIWGTNVIIFALWYWEIDRGGPAARCTRHEAAPDFLFPQMTTERLAPGWRPGFIDYLFVSFTNATAFSPTDTLPLTPSAKLLMMLEATISLLTVALVAARAVNILA